ncbi:TPA: alanine racemase C-terminal domain-containing protein, partial [Aeromonas salmonicida]
PGAGDKTGDEVILWGDGLPVEQVAEKIGTIPYELLTRLTSRVVIKPASKRGALTTAS